ncbi:CpaF family protein [Carnobacteriaceae bacterium zg-ZUI252]|nr:CpaF family protein [Carnobacteriaceae bacterium zg-ZUI252]MBS4769612.1 CpaF family protein [Carnobacteriaceae bacterium zg-ZUI240]
MEKLVELVKSQLLLLGDLSHYTDTQLQNVLVETVERMANLHAILIDPFEKKTIVTQLYHQLRGYGIIDDLLKDDDITEIMINRYNLIFIEKNGRLQKTNLSFDSVEQLNDVIQKIVNQSGREVNYANPIVDTRLLDGSRVNVVLSPISVIGPVVTIRKFAKDPLTMDKLQAMGALDEEMSQFLKRAVRQKQNLLISGGTGTGKTTFLNALSQFIPKKERIVTIEDSAELQLIGKENLVVLETRNDNSAKVGKLTIRDLIKTALRMRPERIIVGEVRGSEAVDMLQAMNTGHAGSMSTIHANSAKDVISRLEMMVLMASDNLPLKAIRQQIAASIHFIVHLERIENGKRAVQSIHRIVGVHHDNVQIECLYERQRGKKGDKQK